MIVERDFEFRRTHSIRELLGLLSNQGITLNISNDEMDLMDTIYLPSKYPIYSALPNALPEPEICKDAMKIAEKVRDSISGILKKTNLSQAQPSFQLRWISGDHEPGKGTTRLTAYGLFMQTLIPPLFS